MLYGVFFFGVMGFLLVSRHIPDELSACLSVVGASKRLGFLKWGYPNS
jgi:hypothetical protein